MRTLRELCGRELYFLRADQSVLDASRYMSERHVGAVAVMANDRLAGIFSERDLLTRVAAKGLDPATTLLSSVMTANPVVVDISESVARCLLVMRQVNCRHLPVVAEGRLAGMISLRDAMQADIGEKAEEIAMMRAYIHSVPPGTESPE